MVAVVAPEDDDRVVPELQAIHRVEDAADLGVDEGDRFRNLLEPIICFMAVAEEAVTARDIAGWMNASDHFTKTTDRTVEDVLKHQWGQFVNRGEEKPAKYSIYHQSFLEFLTRKVDMERYEVGIAEALYKEFK